MYRNYENNIHLLSQGYVTSVWYGCVFKYERAHILMSSVSLDCSMFIEADAFYEPACWFWFDCLSSFAPGVDCLCLPTIGITGDQHVYPSFTWVLGAQTLVPSLRQEALSPWSHLPQPFRAVARGGARAGAGKKQTLEPCNLEFKSHLWHLVCTLHVPQASAFLFDK